MGCKSFSCLTFVVEEKIELSLDFTNYLIDYIRNTEVFRSVKMI